MNSTEALAHLEEIIKRTDQYLEVLRCESFGGHVEAEVTGSSMDADFVDGITVWLRDSDIDRNQWGCDTCGHGTTWIVRGYLR